MKRWPLWTMLLPLVAGVVVWFLLWGGHRDRLVADMQRFLPEGTEISSGGFPYRLEASVAAVDVGRNDVALQSRLTAKEITVNRQPWQPARQVLNLTESVATVRLKPIAAADVQVSAGKAQASLRVEAGKIARLSMVWEAPKIVMGLLPVPVKAETLEAHFRETPGGKVDKASPRLPTQDQLVVSGTGVRFGEGDPLTVQMDSEITASGPVKTLAGWLEGGTVEVRSLIVSDKTGEVARMKATFVPGLVGDLRVAGTIETVCPASVRAAFAGLPPVSEKRARKAQLLPFAGVLPGGVVIASADASKPLPPVRGQEPACPRLR